MESRVYITRFEKLGKPVGTLAQAHITRGKQLYAKVAGTVDLAGVNGYKICQESMRGFLAGVH